MIFPHIREILKNYFGENINTKRHRVFLNRHLTIDDVKQEILDHFDDDDTEKNEFFSSLVDNLSETVIDKKRRNVRNELTKIEYIKE